MDNSEFDALAMSYDADFTTSPIGKLQRMQVYAHLVPILKALCGNKILELGCGTGEDAIWFAQRKYSITAIDSSIEMIKVAKQKTEHAGLQSFITYQQLSIESLEQLPEGLKFDLIFSDFGPLNCVAPDHLSTLATSMYDRLEPGGHFVAVIMNKFCLWESAYFFLKGAFRKVFRRMTEQGIMAPLGHSMKIITWYFSPSSFYHYFIPYFKQGEVLPIGFFVPPSYMSGAHQGKNEMLLNFLGALDRYNPIKGMCSRASDHFFIDLIRK